MTGILLRVQEDHADCVNLNMKEACIAIYLSLCCIEAFLVSKRGLTFLQVERT
jgi:hypothetical protein